MNRVRSAHAILISALEPLQPPTSRKVDNQKCLFICSRVSISIERSASSGERRATSDEPNQREAGRQTEQNANAEAAAKELRNAAAAAATVTVCRCQQKPRCPRCRRPRFRSEQKAPRGQQLSLTLALYHAQWQCFGRSGRPSPFSRRRRRRRRRRRLSSQQPVDASRPLARCPRRQEARPACCCVACPPLNSLVVL